VKELKKERRRRRLKWRQRKSHLLFLFSQPRNFAFSFPQSSESSELRSSSRNDCNRASRRRRTLSRNRKRWRERQTDIETGDREKRGRTEEKTRFLFC
jgi:hypothetical protein